MDKKNAILALIVLVVIVVIFVSRDTSDKEKSELIIFHAGSLSVPFQEISRVFQENNPDIIVKAEAAGSRACARKISDLGRRCDIMASADYKVVENLLMPGYADFNIRFALNEMAIAFTENSRFSDSISADNWYEILLKDNVAFARSDPNLDPCGYRTLMLFQLAKRFYNIRGLAQKLYKKNKYLRPKETDMLALLETGEVDYIFIYRSVAKQHKLNILLLPDQINLKSPKYREFYKQATVKLSGKKQGEFLTRKGEPMIYSVTIPKNAENKQTAEKWISFLLSAQGQEIMERHGQEFLKPPKIDGFDNMPDSLKILSE